MKTYSIGQAKLLARSVMGYPVSDRRLRKWIRTCGILPYAKAVTEYQLTLVLAYACLRRESQRRRITVDLCRIYFATNRDRLAAMLTHVPYHMPPLEGEYRLKALPELIKLRSECGRRPCLRTLRRWRKELGIQLDKPGFLSAYAVQLLIEHADRIQRNKQERAAALNGKSGGRRCG